MRINCNPLFQLNEKRVNFPKLNSIISKSSYQEFISLYDISLPHLPTYIFQKFLIFSFLENKLTIIIKSNYILKKHFARYNNLLLFFLRDSLRYSNKSSILTFEYHKVTCSFRFIYTSYLLKCSIILSFFKKCCWQHTISQVKIPINDILKENICNRYYRKRVDISNL